jgi:aminoglycoside phosphotransferase (APT) family kinase protein
VTETITAEPGLAELIDEAGGRVVCLAMSKDPNAKVTMLLFRAGEDLPGYVAKVPTTDAAVRSVQSEAGGLAYVGDRDLGPIADTIPRVISMAHHCGRPVLVTTAVPGQVMLAAYHTWRHTARPAAVRADFDAAGQWLAQLQLRTARGGSDLADALGTAAEVIAARFRAEPGLAADLDQLAVLRDRLAGHPVPQVVVHGDFWPGNLLLSGGTVSGVVDWECAWPDGPPTRDLARFMISYSLYLDRHTRAGRPVAGHPGLRAGQWGAGLEYAVDGTGWYPALARGFVTDGLCRLGVAAGLWRDVVLAELACIAAEADHPDFARSHLLLLRRLSASGGRR